MFVRHEISSSNMSKTVLPRISQFYTDIIPTLSTATPDMMYDVIIYFRSEVIAKRLSKIPPPTASGGISPERFKVGSRNFTHLSRTIGLINLLERTSLAVSGRMDAKYY